jgi:hypothetical protein
VNPYAVFYHALGIPPAFEAGSPPSVSFEVEETVYVWERGTFLILDWMDYVPFSS